MNNGDIVFCINASGLEKIMPGEMFEVLKIEESDPSYCRRVLLDRGFRDGNQMRYWELEQGRFVVLNKYNWCKYFDKFMRHQNPHLPSIRNNYRWRSQCY